MTPRTRLTVWLEMVLIGRCCRLLWIGLVDRGKVDCSAMVQGAPCYEPDTVAAHATYAFDAYYHRMAMAEGTCDFNGVATVTTTDPSHGSCIFPGSNGSNGTFINGTSLAPSSNSTSGSLSTFNESNSVSFMRLFVVLLLSGVFL
ncbi:unnamed protein product [Lactuca saligna]|uniref:X8 domain-containing protein n=1 Tax=Lactuca saligna TaxID=75948 RepID=A0AA36E1H6_LACSI|nr:unnamed protein product [Lactuca saligna]